MKIGRDRGRTCDRPRGLGIAAAAAGNIISVEGSGRGPIKNITPGEKSGRPKLVDRRHHYLDISRSNSRREKEISCSKNIYYHRWILTYDPWNRKEIWESGKNCLGKDSSNSRKGNSREKLSRRKHANAIYVYTYVYIHDIICKRRLIFWEIPREAHGTNERRTNATASVSYRREYREYRLRFHAPVAFLPPLPLPWASE